jgi:hypothetical protein
MKRLMQDLGITLMGFGFFLFAISSQVSSLNCYSSSKAGIYPYAQIICPVYKHFGVMSQSDVISCSLALLFTGALLLFVNRFVFNRVFS